MLILRVLTRDLSGSVDGPTTNGEHPTDIILNYFIYIFSFILYIQRPFTQVI